MGLEIRKLSIDDGMDVYTMLQEIPAEENGFVHPVNGMTFEEYREWLKTSAAEAEQVGLVDGWRVPQTTFWLFEDGRPVGIGRVRHFLTDALRENGGSIGYAIRPGERGRGLGERFLSLLIGECRNIGLDSILITALNSNTPSIRAALANGGRIGRVTAEKHYIWIEP